MLARLSFALGLMSFMAAASGQVIEYKFSGTWNQAGFGIRAGDPFEIGFRVGNSDDYGLGTPPTLGAYVDGVKNAESYFILPFSGYSYSSPGFPGRTYLGIYNGGGGISRTYPNADGVTFNFAFCSFPCTASPVTLGGALIKDFGVGLYDYSGRALSSALKSAPMGTGVSSYPDSRIAVLNDVNNNRITGTVNNFSASFVQSAGHTPVNYGLFVGAKDFLINFDENASRMATAFAKTPNSVAKTIVGDLNSDGNGNMKNPISVQAIEAAMTDLRSKMLPGDTFTFYINNHGGGSKLDPITGQLNATNDKGIGDDIIIVGEYLFDNQLATMLQKFNGFQKVIYLDSCHSGGFWGGTDGAEEISLGGLGKDDLNSLRNIAVFAAAPEDGLGYGAGFDQTFWGQALEKAIGMGLTGQQMQDFLHAETQKIVYNSNSPVWYEHGLGDLVPADPSLIKTFSARSDDFDFNARLLSPVPENSTLALSLLGLAGLAFLRRKQLFAATGSGASH